MSSDLKFCGREAELQALIEAWRLASDLANPQPQLVVIKAERGLGKTRLALEFFRWLSAQTGAAADGGYWPEALDSIGRNLAVNPDPLDCQFSLPIPFLWWGLRAGDKGAENGVAGDAVATYDKFLAPHLIALTMRSRMISTGRTLAEAWADVGLDFLSGAFGLDALLSVGKGALNTVQILSGEIRQSTAEAARKEATQGVKSRAEAVLEDFDSIFNPKSLGYAKTPAVLLLDDGQFAEDDPGLLHLVETLLQAAFTRDWPLMVMVTHWKRELSHKAAAKDSSFAGILHYARTGIPPEQRPNPGFPGGYLAAERYRELDLEPVASLSRALSGSLPGLTEEQESAILDRAGGNPRFLEQMVALVSQRRSYFEGRDPSGPLSEKGLQALLTTAVDIRNVVYERLMDAPEPVKEAIACASPQGVRFACSLADAVAESVLGASCLEGLAQAEEPYSVMTGTGGEGERVAAFAERLFWEVALEVRDELERVPGGGDELDEALREVLISHLVSFEQEPDIEVEDRIMTLGVAANVFSQTVEEGDAALALAALAQLASLEQERHAFEASLAAAERFAALHADYPDDVVEVSPVLVQACARLLQSAGQTETALSILRPLVGRQRLLAEQAESPDDEVNLPILLIDLGSIEQTGGDLEAADRAFRESLALSRELADRNDTVDELLHVSIALDSVGRVAQDRGDLDEAERAYAESLNLRRDLAARQDTPESLRPLALALAKSGEIAEALGRYDEASELYQESLEKSRSVADALNDPTSLGDLSVALDLMGKITEHRGDFDLASRYFQDSLDKKRDLAERLGSPLSLSDLARSLQNIGRMSSARGDSSAAKEAFDECLDLRRNLAERLKTPDSLRDLSDALSHVGGTATERQEHELAAALLTESLELARELADRQKTPQSLRDLSRVLRRFGNAAQARGDLAAAVEAHEEAVDIARELAAELQTPISLRDICHALDGLGSAVEARGDHDSARTAYEECLRITRDLLADYQTPYFEIELCRYLYRCGINALEREDVERASACKEEFEERLAGLHETVQSRLLHLLDYLKKCLELERARLKEQVGEPGSSPT